jgi:nitrogen PTS system EIIA component
VVDPRANPPVGAAERRQAMATEPAESDELAEANADAAPPAARPRAAGNAAPRLADLLSPEAVVFFPAPVEKSALLARLAEAAAGKPPAVDIARVLGGLELRERDASTFLAEGIALPHVRVVGLTEPRLAVGVPRAGILLDGRDGRGELPMSVVFLFLVPESRPEVGLALLASAARLFRDGRFREGLATAATGREVVALVAAGEVARPVAIERPG